MKRSDRERDLTEGPVAGHVLALAVPTALSLLFVTLYNVTDTLFAGRISTEAQAGLGLGGQLTFLMTALGIGFRLGASAVVGNLLGRKDLDEAAHASAQVLLAAVAATVATVGIGVLGADPVVQWVAKGDAYGEAATTYILWMLGSAPGFVVGLTLAGLLGAAGDAQSLARAQAGAALANVGLNPLLVSGIPGLWDGLGLPGIALATVICQNTLMLYLIVVYRSTRVARAMGRAHLQPRADLWRELLGQVVPGTGRLLVIVVGGFLVQLWLQPAGETAVAAYNVGLRLEQLLLLPAIGVTAALLPFVSQNMGAGRPERVREAFWLGLSGGVALLGLGVATVWLAGAAIVGAFGADPEAGALALDYLKVESVVFPLFAVLFALQNLLQGLKRPIGPMLVGIWRQGPGLLLLGWIYVDLLDLGPQGVWYTIATGVVTGTLLVIAATWRIAPQEGLRLWPPALPSRGA